MSSKRESCFSLVVHEISTELKNIQEFIHKIKSDYWSDSFAEWRENDWIENTHEKILLLTFPLQIHSWTFRAWRITNGEKQGDSDVFFGRDLLNVNWDLLVNLFIDWKISPPHNVSCCRVFDVIYRAREGMFHQISKHWEVSRKTRW